LAYVTVRAVHLANLPASADPEKRATLDRNLENVSPMVKSVCGPRKKTKKR